MNNIILRQPLKNSIITQQFGEDFKIYRNGKWQWFYKDLYGLKGHMGLDYRCNVGTPIYSAHDGICMYAKYDSVNGNLVQIWNEELGFKTVYGHNSEFKVKQGDKVKAGQIIALSGNTGDGTGPHSHFGMKMTGSGGNGLNNNNGFNGAIDPTPFIKQDYLGNNLTQPKEEDMIFKKEKNSSSVYLINEEYGTRIMIVDMPTLDVLKGKIQEVDSLEKYIELGTLIWTERIIN